MAARAAAIAGLAMLVMLSVGCSTSSDESVRIDGSFTVFPLTATAAEDFRAVRPDVQVTVGSSGTGGGFEKFCRGETDANDASREVTDDERAKCEANGIAFDGLHVANDALTVIVSSDNDWARCLTVDQLGSIWEPGSTIDNWNQVDPSFPAEEISLFGPGTASGTFDYFTGVITGAEGASRTDFTPSEDDNVTASGVAGSAGGLGYLGFTYYAENTERLRAVAIDSGNGCVLPSAESEQDGTYRPLARPPLV